MKSTIKSASNGINIFVTISIRAALDQVNYLSRKPEPSIMVMNKIRPEVLPIMAQAQIMPSDEVFGSTIFLGTEYRANDHIILGMDNLIFKSI